MANVQDYILTINTLGFMSEFIKQQPLFPYVSYPVYKLLFSGACLFLSVATATSVHDITKIFITPASKSRQTDDKHACGWVSFV